MTQPLPSGVFVFGTLLSASLLLSPDASFAAGRGNQVKTPVTSGAKAKPAEVLQDPLETSSFTKATGEDDASCVTARKKLWIEGEGWIVRRVTTCQ